MASKLVDEIMGDLAKKKGGAPPGAGDVSEETEAEEYASDEERAMADFTDATTPAEKAAAMKAFLEICVPKIVSGGGEEDVEEPIEE